MGNFTAQDFKKFKFPIFGSKTLASLKYVKESLSVVRGKEKNIVELLFWNMCLRDFYDYSVANYKKYLTTHGVFKPSSSKEEAKEIKGDVPKTIVSYIARMGTYSVKWIPTGKEIDKTLDNFNGEEQKNKLLIIFQTDIQPFLGKYKPLVTEKRFIDIESKNFSSYTKDLGDCVSSWANSLQYISKGLRKIK